MFLKEVHDGDLITLEITAAVPDEALAGEWAIGELAVRVRGAPAPVDPNTILTLSLQLMARFIGESPDHALALKHVQAATAGLVWGSSKVGEEPKRTAPEEPEEPVMGLAKRIARWAYERAARSS